MKIYFAGSIRGGRDDIQTYQEIIKFISKFGTVLTEHVGDPLLTNEGEKENLEHFIYNRDLNWLKESDVVVAEVTIDITLQNRTDIIIRIRSNQI